LAAPNRWSARLKIIERRDLLARIERFEPRFVRVVAPAGYGKTILAQQISARYTLSALCDLAGATSGLDIAKRLLTALTAWLGPEGDKLLMAAATSDNDLPTWMRFIDVAWSSHTADGVLIIDNFEFVNNDAGLREPLDRLFLKPNEHRTIVICSRETIALRPNRFASPPNTMALRHSELRLTDKEIEELLPLSDLDAKYISDLTGGWPMAIQLIVRLLESKEISGIDDLPSHGSFDDLYGYLAEHVLAALPQHKRDLVALVASIPQCTMADLHAFSQGDLEGDLAGLEPFVIRNRDGIIAAHPLIKSTVKSTVGRYGFRYSAALQSAARAALRDSRFERAAQLFAIDGDTDNCAKALDAAQMHITAPTPTLLDLTLSLSDETLLRYPMLWCTAIFLSRSLGADKHDWVANGERFWAGFAPDESLAARATLFVVLCNGYMNIGAYDKGMAFYQEFVDSISPDEADALRAPLAIARGVLTVPSERTVDLETLERDAAPILETPATRALWLYEITARIHRVSGDRISERASLATAVEIAVDLGLPMVICAASLDATFASWFAGDESLSEHYGSILERNVIPSTIRGCRPMLDVLAGRYDRIDPANAKKKSLCYAYVMSAARETNLQARAHYAMQAIIAADQSKQPFAQILSRVTLATLASHRQETLFAEANIIAATIAPERLRDDTRKVSQNRPNGTIFEPLIERLTPKRRAAALRTSPTFRLKFLSGQLENDDGAIRLRRRELEICMFLSLRGRATSTGEIVAAIWNGAQSAVNSVKVHVSRIRKATGNDHVILSTESGYLLSELTTSDVFEIRDLIRSLARDRLIDGWEQTKVDTLVSWLASVRLALTEPFTDGEWYSDALQNLSVEIREVLVAAARDGITRGRDAAALAIGEHLLSLDRCDEAGVEICIRASMNLGDDFGARCYLRDYEKQLVEAIGLGAEPYIRSLVYPDETNAWDSSLATVASKVYSGQFTHGDVELA
jgi:DNA-binding SARP family transcriptional activator